MTHIWVVLSPKCFWPKISQECLVNYHHSLNRTKWVLVEGSPMKLWRQNIYSWVKRQNLDLVTWPTRNSFTQLWWDHNQPQEQATDTSQAFSSWYQQEKNTWLVNTYHTYSLTNDPLVPIYLHNILRGPQGTQARDASQDGNCGMCGRTTPEADNACRVKMMAPQMVEVHISNSSEMGCSPQVGTSSQ